MARFSHPCRSPGRLRRCEAVREPEDIAAALESLVNHRRLPRHVVVPDVVGKTMREAWAALAKADVRFRVRHVVDDPPPTEGRVIAQSVAPGTKLRRDRQVTLLLEFPTL